VTLSENPNRLIGVIIFSSVRFLSKKITKLIFLKKKTETGSNRPVSVRFGFFGKNRFKSVWLEFDSVFSGLARFFWFQAYKTETKPVGFFKTLIGLIGFFSRFDFFSYFFFNFLSLISFLIFLLTLTS
jgi:hypothetical protein